MVHFFGDLGNHERLKLVIDWDPGPARNQAFTGIPAKNGQSRPRLEVDSRYEFRHFSSCLARARRIGHARNLFNLLRGIHKLPGARAPAPTRSILRGSRIRSGSDPGPSRAWEYIKDFRKFLAILTPSPRPQVSEILDFPDFRILFEV